MEGVEFLWKLGAFMVAAGAVYGGIRNDLKTIHVQLAEHKQDLKDLTKRMNDCVVCFGRRDGDR